MHEHLIPPWDTYQPEEPEPEEDKPPNKKVADLCSCEDSWPFASPQYSNRCKTCGLIITEQD